MIENLILLNRITGVRTYVANINRAGLSGYMAGLEGTLMHAGNTAKITVEAVGPEEWKEIRGKHPCPKCEERKKKGVSP